MRTGVVALALSALALGTAVVALTREGPQSQRVPLGLDRVAALEARVAELARDVEVLKAGRPGPARGDISDLPFVEQPADAGETAVRPDLAHGEEELKAIVDDAVERKTELVLDELRIKANKKPAIEVFASVLELTEEQRAVTERVIVDGQRQIHRILETPTYDGTQLMDQLVEIAARGIAQPGKDHGFGRWLGRVLTEQMPGTNETYGARIESVKNTMRAAFKREWSETQYREFEAWGVDPSEVEKVPGSPNEAVYKRIVERARALGADVPGDR